MLPPTGLFKKYALPTLDWVLRSVDATGGKGSAGYFSLCSSWSSAYPETTGYLVETLFDCFQRTQNQVVKNTALACADWLCNIQLPDGSFRGGIGGKLPPLVFDTGMILFGLSRAWLETGKDDYREAATKSLSWLENQLDEDGIWRRHSYVPGHFPSYNTMIVWAMLLTKKRLGIDKPRRRLERSLLFFSEKITPVLSVKDWSFRPGEPAPTHLIGYVLQGMLEAGLLLNANEIIGQVAAVAEKILAKRQEQGKLAGSYDEHWKGDFSFRCLVGQAQISLVYFRLHQIFGAAKWHDEGQFLLLDLLRFQSRFPVAGCRGGIPGSDPFWKKYQRFRYPNWAAKFFLDACLAAGW